MRYTLAVFCLALSSILPTHGHEEKGVGDHRDVYITEVKGDFLFTTHENLFIFSQRREGKSNLLTANEEELLYVTLLIPITWPQLGGPDLKIYNKEDGKRALLGDFPLRNIGKTLHIVPERDSYVFTIRKKYFDQSTIILTSGTLSSGYEAIYLHLYPDPNKKASKAEMPPPVKTSN